MRKLAILMLALALTATPASAADEQSPLEIVQALADYVATEGADFDGANPLYKRAKEAIAAEAEAVPADQPRPAAALYEQIRGRVADTMRRDELPVSAWLMGIFGATLMWGGLAFCIGVARKKGGSGGKGAA